MTRPTRRWMAAFTLTTLTLFGPATTFASLRAGSDDALARSSAAAVHGRVTEVASAWDPEVDGLYTYVTIDVLRSWGLEGSPTRVVVKQLGGVVGHTAFLVGGQARFEVGEEVLVFLDVRPRDRTLSVSGFEQGKWIMTGAADAVTAATRETRGHAPGTVASRDFRTAADLDALAALAGTRVSATGAVLQPDPGALAPDAGGGRAGPSFTLLNPSVPARWHQGDTGLAVYVDTETGGHPQFAGGGLTQLARAAAAWTGPGSLNLQMGVARGPRCFSNSESDARISVTYGDPCGEIADGSGTLAIGGAYFSSDRRTVNGVSYWRILKGMVITDNVSTKYSWMSTGCYEDMITHELGHAIGFGHSAASGAVMAPAIASGCTGRTTGLPLQPDDLAAVAAVYPAGQVTPPSPSAPSTPAALGALVSGSTVTISWTPALSGGTATSFQLRAGSAPGASDYGAATVMGTSLVVPDVPNGTYYIRLLAVNAEGASAPTADQVVTVGTAPPGAPRSLTASAAAGRIVTISWQVPGSGGTPTGYVILAGPTTGSSLYQVPVSGVSVSGPVPAGTYYLRMVAVNGAGAGPVSSEVVLVVP